MKKLTARQCPEQHQSSLLWCVNETMAPIKRKKGSGEELDAPSPRIQSVGDRPQKKARKSYEGPVTTISDPATKPLKTSSVKPSTSVSLLCAEEPAFPRGGASVLTPLEHKQIKVDATRDVLFEQGNSKRSKNAPDDDEDLLGADSKPEKRKTKSKSKAKGKKGQPSVEDKENEVRIERLSYKVSHGTEHHGQC